MIGFLIKKTFFDLWDNLFRVALINLGFIASLAFPVFIPGLLLSVPALSLAAMLAGILWCCVYLAAAALSLRALSDYGAFGFADFFRNLKAGWPAGVVMGLFAFFVWIMCTVAIPFYLSMSSPVGLLFAALIFWTLVVAVLSLQFLPAVRARLDTNLLKVLKKCFLIFFDNTGFCVFSLLHNLVILAVSLLLAFLFPGPAGILLFLDEGLRLRLLKYDWLEADGAAAKATAGGAKGRRRPIPWDAILIDERERTGTRSVKNFIFPWKD
ncbi:MAG: hypothetical protein LBQ55_02940 [Treponema sp.]|jgi:hypothetical protein|nr:hypothetical protein [Treponema sp.]